VLAFPARPKRSCEETQYQKGTVPLRKLQPVAEESLHYCVPVGQAYTADSERTGRNGPNILFNKNILTGRLANLAMSGFQAQKTLILRRRIPTLLCTCVLFLYLSCQAQLMNGCANSLQVGKFHLRILAGNKDTVRAAMKGS
jgi:hypothetical protein